MAYTVQQCYDDAHLAYRDLSSANALLYAQETWDEVCRDARLLQAYADVSVTANVRDYALSAAIKRVWSAVWYQSEDQYWTLVPTNKRRLDERSAVWRQLASTDPSEFYVDAAEPATTGTGALTLGLTPAPSTTTDGGTGYPLVRIYVTQSSTLIMGTTLPNLVDTRRVLIAGMRAKHCYARKDWKGFQIEDQVYAREKSAFALALSALAPDAPAEMHPGFSQVRRRI